MYENAFLNGYLGFVNIILVKTLVCLYELVLTKLNSGKFMIWLQTTRIRKIGCYLKINGHFETIKRMNFIYELNRHNFHISL